MRCIEACLLLSDCMEMISVETTTINSRRSRLHDLYLLDGLLARGRKDAQCSPGHRKIKVEALGV